MSKKKTTEVGTPIRTALPWRWPIVAAATAGVFLLSIALYLAYASTVGNQALREMCSRQAGVTVYREASADGYFDNGLSCLSLGCWDTLLTSGYSYIETSVPAMGHVDQTAKTGAPRYFRYSVVDRDDPDCSEHFLNDIQTKKYYARRYGDTGLCVAVKEIAEPMARYESIFRRLPVIVLDNPFRSEVGRNYMAIYDRQKNEVIAEQVVPYLFRKSLPVLSSFSSFVSCAEVGVETRAHPVNWVSKYVIPIQLKADSASGH